LKTASTSLAILSIMSLLSIFFASPVSAFEEPTVQLEQASSPSVHDVEVANIVADKTVEIGSVENVLVTVRNVGDFQENFYLILLVNETGTTFEEVSLNSHEEANVTLHLDTSWWIKVGTYVLKPLPVLAPASEIHLIPLNTINQTVTIAVIPSVSTEPTKQPSVSPPPTPPKANFGYGSFWITSPSNETYDSNSPLSLDVKVEVIMKSNCQLFLKYSLDNQVNLTLPVKLTEEPDSMYFGSFDVTTSLSPLSAGSHKITVFGDFEVWNTTVESGPQSSQIAVYFAVNSSSFSKTIEPSSTPIHQTGFLGTTLPLEYGFAILAVLVIIVVAGLSVVYLKKRRK
jgi:hypothetical protein